MTRRAVILIGGGEHARLVADAVRSSPAAFELIGFVDPKPDRTMAALLRVPHLGDDTALTGYPDALAVVAFGTSQRGSGRREVVARLAPTVSGWATVVHRDARVAQDTVLGEGAVVLPGAVVLLGARIGAHAVIDAMAFVGHDVTIGDYTFVAAGAMVGGGASVGGGAFLGLGALIRDHCAVGADAFVGMGAIVVSDVASGARVVPRGIGIPGPQAWKSS
jgi:sugar O-acyltransferase (sialic acid O-acetyltransferase NeuD family)